MWNLEYQNDVLVKSVTWSLMRRTIFKSKEEKNLLVIYIWQ